MQKPALRGGGNQRLQRAARGLPREIQRERKRERHVEDACRRAADKWLSAKTLETFDEDLGKRRESLRPARGVREL